MSTVSISLVTSPDGTLVGPPTQQLRLAAQTHIR